MTPSIIVLFADLKPGGTGTIEVETALITTVVVVKLITVPGVDVRSDLLVTVRTVVVDEDTTGGAAPTFGGLVVVTDPYLVIIFVFVTGNGLIVVVDRTVTVRVHGASTADQDVVVAMACDCALGVVHLIEGN